MNFNKIKSICEEKGLTIPLLADKIGLSEAGLYQSFRNQSMKVDVIEKIAEVLETPIWIFFDLDPGSQIDALNEEIAGYKKTIENLEAKMSDINKELFVSNTMLDLSHVMIETKDKLLVNYEKLQISNEKVKKAEKMMPKILKSMLTLSDLVQGKIREDSPEAKKVLGLTQEDFLLTTNREKEKE